MKKKGFTLIELMIIVGIIGLLAVIILALWAISAQNKAAINSYKTSMESVRTAIEMCLGSGGTVLDNPPGSSICNPDNGTKYPTLSSKCGNISQFVTTGGESNWAVTTNAGCKNCRLICNVEGCEAAEEGTCD